jgi:hypothetical protein
VKGSNRSVDYTLQIRRASSGLFGTGIFGWSKEHLNESLRDRRIIAQNYRWQLTCINA